jgi:hypothetical protein
VAKEKVNNFPGPAPDDHVIIKFVSGPGPEGEVIGVFDDAYVIQQEDGGYVVCAKAAIESIWIQSVEAMEEKKEGVE